MLSVGDKAFRTIRHSMALRISLTYSAIGTLWICASDRLLSTQYVDPVLHSSLGTTKGLVFIAVTGVALYLLVSREARKLQSSNEALSRTQAEYRDLVERSNSLIFKLNPKGEITFINEYAQKFFGFTAEQILGKPAIGTIVPELDSEGRDLTNMVQNVFERPDLYETNQNENMKADGTRVWISWSNKVIRDSQQNFTEMFCIGHDVTERRAQNAQVRFQAQLLDAVSEAVIATDRNCRVTHWGKGAESLYGYSAQEAIGENIHSLLSPEEQTRLDIAQRVLQTGSWWGHALKNRKNGSRFWTETHISLVSDDLGKPTGFVSISHDITAQRNLENQLCEAQKMEAIGTLSGGIAHDFNNILAIIVGYTELASTLAKRGSRDVTTHLDNVLDASMRARELIQQILAFSRKGDEPERRPMQIGPQIKGTLKLLRATLPTTIQIRGDIEDGIALVDPTQFHQVLLNLCTNAAHAMNDQGVLAISLSQITINQNGDSSIQNIAPGPYLKLTIADTGHGMDQQTMERIFDPYFTTKEIGKGTGLGLAVVHGIVKRHEGVITVKSQPGKGTTFDIYIPQIEQQAITEKTARNKEVLPIGTERVLFLDDEEMIAALGKGLLERIGYEVKSYTSSQEALADFVTNPDQFDIIITDFTMPEMTGLDFAKAAIKIRPNIPIILCSGYTEKITEKTVQEMGVHFALKPLERKDLARLVRKALDESRERQTA